MIPRQLFFIWLGNDKPGYVDFCINAFRKVNPDFKIDLIRYTVEEIENYDKLQSSIYDEDLKNCIHYIQTEKDKYVELIQEYKKYGRKFIQVIANILRLILINKYGGIYLDCDTFPLKKFDNELLSNDTFCTSTYVDLQNKRKLDCFFLGCKKGIYTKNYYFKKRYETHDLYYIKSKEWIDSKKMFYKCELEINLDDKSPYYIEHFQDRTWLRNKTPLCKFDIS